MPLATAKSHPCKFIPFFNLLLNVVLVCPHEFIVDINGEKNLSLDDTATSCMHFVVTFKDVIHLVNSSIFVCVYSLCWFGKFLKTSCVVAGSSMLDQRETSLAS